jgi:hypothetical protein
MKLVSKADLIKQHAIGQLLRPVYEHQLQKKIIYRNWQNKPEPKTTTSPRFT